MVEAIIWVMRTGAPWADLPRRYPPYQTCHRWFQTWSSRGTIKALHGLLARRRRQDNGTEGFIDGSYVPAKRGGECVGRCRAGNATKIMTVVDARGRPIAVSIESGARHDVSLVDLTLDEAVTRLPHKLIGDKAFDSADLAGRLRDERNIELIAPKRGNNKRRQQDGRPMRRYKRRWMVERLFGWLKRFRRIAVRWERLAHNYLGFLHLACALILLKQA